MAVLDGKYEILAQRGLKEGQTFFTATAPDGRTLHIFWLELGSPHQESRFESYRQLLRQLNKAGRAAIHDIVSRPGAHYVAWYAPNGKPRSAADPELADMLRRYGYQSDQADLRSGAQGEAVVYALAFDETSLPLEPDPVVSAPPEAPPAKPWLHRVPDSVLSWLLGGGLLLLAGALLLTGFRLSVERQLVTVPDLQGQNVNAAARALHALGLAAVLQAEGSEAETFSVTAIEPRPGTLLRSGQDVRLSYALPHGQLGVAEVPQLRGLRLADDLSSRLETAQLRLGNVAYIHANSPENLIIAQSPPAGSRLEQGQAVQVLVSLGPVSEQTFLPDLTGLSYEEALDWAQLADVTVEQPRYQNDARYLPNTVLEQYPPANTPFPQRETSLQLTLAGSGGDSPEDGAPSLIGLSESEATELARAAGYEVSTRWIESTADSLNLPEGVVSQTPAPGTVSESRSLELLVNAHPVPVPRPEVSASVTPPSLRELEYLFQVEPGLGTLEARITAATLSGNHYTVVAGRSVQGGQQLSGSWRTLEPGPVTFTLELNGAFYDRQTRND